MLKKFLILSIVVLCVQLIVAQTFQEECLEAHNNYRKQHGVQDLNLDDTLQKLAQQWATNLAQTGRFEHRPYNKYGENLYKAFGSANIKGSRAVDAWYDENKYYNYNRPGFTMQTEHFTQLVWKNSKKLGCAIAKSGQNSYVVANYDPPGNYAGKFSTNVFKKR